MQFRCRQIAALAVLFTTLASVFLGSATVSAQAGSAANDASAGAAVSPSVTPTPSVDTYAVPAPSAMPGSSTFAFVTNVQCTDLVANATFRIYSNNRALFDACVVEGKYQIFPYPGTLPTQAQVDSMVRSSSCRSVFTACVLGNLPQCDIGGMALKSATETLLKIAVDVLGGKPAPDSEKFYELLLWRRDVNLAQVRGLPYDQSSQLYAEYSRNLWKALTNTNVKVSEDLTITIEGSNVTTTAVFANVSSGSNASDIVGKVSAPDASGGGSFVNNASNNGTSSAPAPHSQSLTLQVVAATVLLALTLGSLE